MKFPKYGKFIKCLGEGDREGGRKVRKGKKKEEEKSGCVIF